MASGNYRADHIGSLFPVPGSAGEFADDPVAGAVDAQLKAVMDIFTDGKPVGRVDGAASAVSALRERAPSWAKLKVTLPAPGVASLTAASGEDSEQASDRIVECANELLGKGVAYVQFEAREYSRRLQSGDLDADSGRRLLAADRAALLGLAVPEGSTTGFDVGAAAPFFAADEQLATVLFDVPVSRFLIGFARDPGELSLLRLLPPDRFAVLGLVDAATTEIEDPEPLLERIDAAAELHGDLLAVCPTQGFGPQQAVGGMTAFTQQQKLTLVSDVARMFWGTEL